MKDKRERFIELLSPTSKNFLGTGLTMAEFMALDMAERFANSWAVIDREEKIRRLDLVIDLCFEMKKIQEQTQFSIGLARTAIGCLIEGDWHGLHSYIELFSMNDEDPRIKERMGPIYQRFCELLGVAYNTRPGTKTGQA